MSLKQDLKWCASKPKKRRLLEIDHKQARHLLRLYDKPAIPENRFAVFDMDGFYIESARDQFVGFYKDIAAATHKANGCTDILNTCILDTWTGKWLDYRPAQS